MKKKKQTKKTQITKDMKLSEIMEKYPEVAEVFYKHGMMCIGCPLAMQETIEQGAIAHKINVKKLIEELNKKLKNKDDN